MRLDEFMKRSQAPQDDTGELDCSTLLSPLGTPAAVTAAYADGAGRLDRCPVDEYNALCAAVAAKEHADPAHVVCGAGTAELLCRILAAIQPQRTILPAPCPVVAEKTFAAMGCAVSRCMLWEVRNFAMGEAFAASVNTETDMAYLPNPCDPTGQLAAPEVAAAILTKCARMGAYLVVDESLMEFTDAPGDASLLRYVPRFPNLIVLKSFSSLYAMPGARLAYCVTSNPVLLEKLRALAPLPVITAGACKAGMAALASREHLQRTRVLAHLERPKLAAALKDAGLAVYHSDANFLLVRADKPGFSDLLAAEGIKVKNCGDCAGLSEAYCRIAVRSAADNARLVAAVKKVLAE